MPCLQWEAVCKTGRAGAQLISCRAASQTARNGGVRAGTMGWNNGMRVWCCWVFPWGQEVPHQCCWCGSRGQWQGCGEWEKGLSTPLAGLGTQSLHQANLTAEIPINPAQNSPECSQGAGNSCGEDLLKETRSCPHLGDPFLSAGNLQPKILANQPQASQHMPLCC